VTVAAVANRQPKPIPILMLDVIQLPEPVSYQAGLRLQEERVAAILGGTGGDAVFLLEHEPVFTIGRLRDQSSLRAAGGLPYPVYETNRGGQATYHGPGQWVGYPILDLNPRGRDLHRHLRQLEEALIRASAGFGVVAGRREGFTGVWVENRKLASIGVGVRKWITMHGSAVFRHHPVRTRRGGHDLPGGRSRAGDPDGGGRRRPDGGVARAFRGSKTEDRRLRVVGAGRLQVFHPRSKIPDLRSPILPPALCG